MADIWANTCLGERGSLMVRSDKNPFVSDHMRAAEKYLADEMPDQRRQRANGVTGKKHRTLRTNWGTPSTHRLWPGGGSHMRRATIARPGGPLSGPPSFAVAVGRHPTHHDQSDVPKHSPAFVAPLGHPQHAPAFGGGATVSATGLGRVAQGSDICAAIFCGRRRPGQSASWPINSAKTFTCVCGPFGAPPAHPFYGWVADRIWGGPRLCGRMDHSAGRHRLRSLSGATLHITTNQMFQNIHRRLWPLWGTPSTPLHSAVGPLYLRRAWGALLRGPISVPPFFAVGVGRVRQHPGQSTVPKHSYAFVAPLGHLEHASASTAVSIVHCTHLRSLSLRAPVMMAASSVEDISSLATSVASRSAILRDAIVVPAPRTASSVALLVTYATLPHAALCVPAFLRPSLSLRWLVLLVFGRPIQWAPWVTRGRRASGGSTPPLWHRIWATVPPHLVWLSAWRPCRRAASAIPPLCAVPVPRPDPCIRRGAPASEPIAVDGRRCVTQLGRHSR